MNSDLLCLCNLHPLFLSQVTAHFNSGNCISEGDKDDFWNHDQHLEVVFIIPSIVANPFTVIGVIWRC